MSYEKRPSHSRDALNKLIHSYGAPLGTLLVIVLAALYIYIAGWGGPSAGFQRGREGTVPKARAERRLEELARRLEDNPGDIRALGESGRLKFQYGPERYLEAITDLEKARSLGLADAQSFYYLGVMYQAVGLYDFAAQEYRRFLNNYPDDSEVRMLLAKLYYASGDYAGAVREYEALLRDGSDDLVLLENLALSLWKNGQEYSHPLEMLRARGAQGAFLADYAEGRIKYELKDYSGALPLLKASVSALPSAGDFVSREQLFWMAGDAAAREKDQDAAALYLEELLKVSPGHEEGKRLSEKVRKSLAAAAKAGAQKRAPGK